MMRSLVLAIFVAGALGIDFPVPPFNRLLKLQDPPLTGSDVVIMQNFLLRSRFVKTFPMTGIFDAATENSLKAFQAGSVNTTVTPGVFDALTASELLRLHWRDGYKDDRTILPGYKYKVHVPVHANRSIEVIATLYDSQMKMLRNFTVRAHGQNDAKGNALNEFTGSGNTPTGLMSFDLNSPEDDPKSFGPYPVNRAVEGLKGNAAIFWNNTKTSGHLISDIRDGILMHTGEWDGWDPSKPMPNSHGCIHGHPEDIKSVWQILVKLGVVVNKNTDGKLPYPYVPQGLLSVELID
jgi:hypothetical protein